MTKPTILQVIVTTIATIMLASNANATNEKDAIKPQDPSPIISAPVVKVDLPRYHDHRQERKLAYDKEIERDALTNNRALWDTFSGGTANYNMEFERLCFCIEGWRGPFSLHVRMGQIESATYVTSGDAVNPDWIRGLLTVEGLFAEVDKALEKGYEGLKVTYDETAGFPASVWYKTDPMLADDEKTFMVRNVELLPSLE